MTYLASYWPSNVRAPSVPFGLYNGILLLTHANMCGYRTNLWVSEQAVKQLMMPIVSSDRLPLAIRTFDERGNPTGKRLVYNIDQIVDCETTIGLTIKVASDKPIPPMKR